jgi:kynurenine formamidase
MLTPDGHPAYEDLPAAGDLPARTSWGVFGPDDRIGTLHFLTPDRVAAASRLVRTGEAFPLNWDLELPDPPMFERRPLRHGVRTFSNGTDDWYDDFFPQGSSQWDSLSHIGHPSLGFYGGRTVAQVLAPDNPLGVEQWARRGITGRFVLADVARQRAAAGRPLDMRVGTDITASELDEVLAAQATTLLGGDILLVRFGWIAWYATTDAATRAWLASAGHADTPGLAPEEATAAWLWDHRVAAVAADNPGVERYPSDPAQVVTYLHYRLIPFLGMAVGELFDLDALAAACAADGRWDGLFVAAPLNKRGGSGSTANAVAIR